MSTRLPVGFIVFVLSSVVNPAYLAGCFTVGNDPPNFGEAEMLRSLDHANDKGTWTFESGDATYEVELSLLQKQGEDDLGQESAALPLFSRAYACGNRTFYKSASACSTSTSLALEGALTLRRLDAAGEPTVLLSEVDVSGQLEVYGSQLSNAHIALQLGDEDTAGPYAVQLDSSDGRTYHLRTFQGQDLGADKVDVSFGAR